MRRASVETPGALRLLGGEHFMTMASCASTGPATLAGNLVVGNAEVISALALLQMAYPGCPVYYAAAQTAMDLRTGAYTGGGPEDFLFGGATNQLADFYRVPLSMGALFLNPQEITAMYQTRDTGINYIRARQDHKCYGMGLGIIILDDVYPGFPGDVRNASAYPFPIQYEIVEGVDIQALVWKEDKSPCLPPILRAAQKLEKMGCRAIAAECGYFAYFQKEIAAAVDVPVFMSSLLQVPFAQQLIGPNKIVGVLVALKRFITEAHLRAVGIQPGSNHVIADAQGRVPEFAHLWDANQRPDPVGAYYDKAERDFVKVAVEFYRAQPNMGAMVLECTGMQPFARSIQREIDVPIFSWGTLLDYAYSVAVHRDYYGHV